MGNLVNTTYVVSVNVDLMKLKTDMELLTRKLNEIGSASKEARLALEKWV